MLHRRGFIKRLVAGVLGVAGLKITDAGPPQTAARYVEELLGEFTDLVVSYRAEQTTTRSVGKPPTSQLKAALLLNNNAPRLVELRRRLLRPAGHVLVWGEDSRLRPRSFEARQDMFDGKWVVLWRAETEGYA